MKKYLMTGIAALALCVGFTSCSHDIEQFSEEELQQFEVQKIKANYEQAFIKTFGKPASNQDWGFSNDNASTRAFTRAIQQPSISFPDKCDASHFLTAVPDGVNKLPTSGGGPGTYFIDSTIGFVSTWSGASTIYVTGTVDLSGDDTDVEHPKFAPDYRSEIYLVNGATLKLGEVSALNFNVDAIYIAAGATLETAGHLKSNNSTKVYNRGTVKAGIFEVNSSSFLYNEGTLEAESVNVESNPSRVVNDGTIKCTTVVVNAGAVLNNAGNMLDNEDKTGWTVSGTTKINSNNSGWVNNGYWKTQNYYYIGGSENVINKCFLEVTNNFDMNISSEVGAFKIDAGGGVLAANFYGGRDLTNEPISLAGPYKIIMGEGAVFKVTGTATLVGGRGAMNPGEEGFGFFGPTEGGYAVFQAKKIERNTSLPTSWGYVTYGGNLYVSAETHFTQGNDGTNAHPFIIAFGNFSIKDNIYADGFKSGKPSITIPKSPCNPGFEGGGGADLRIIAEDLSVGDGDEDFDFNDVVIDVYYGEKGYAKAKILAAGGTLELKVDDQEVHKEFSKANNNIDCSGKMINTNGTQSADPNVRSKSLDGLTAPEITLSEAVMTPAQARDNIKIEVYKGGQWIELDAVIGKVASKVRVGTDYTWKNEREYVGDGFKDFVSGQAGYADWYKQ